MKKSMHAVAIAAAMLGQSLPSFHPDFEERRTRKEPKRPGHTELREKRKIKKKLRKQGRRAQK